MRDTTFRENKMGTAKMLPLIISMGLPAMFSMMVQALYNIVDSYYVSTYSTDALSAVSLAMPVQNLIIAFSVGTAIGASSLVSRKLGEGRRDVASSVATHGLVLNVLTWLLFLVFGLVGCEMFYRLFESNDSIVRMGVEYLSIVSAFSIFIFIQLIFEKTFQATGNMILPMVMQLVGAITNIVLDPILIFGYFGLPEMGVAGAAIATVIGQLVAAIIAVFFAFAKRGKKLEIEYKLKGFKVDFGIVKSIYQVGFPSIVMNAVGTAMLMGMNAILSSFSTAAYTVFGLYFRLQSFIFMPVFGLTSGLMPILGYNFGARNKKRLLQCLKIGATIAISINLAGALAFVIFPAELLGLFQPTQEILDIGIPAMRTVSIVYPFAAISITAATLFQAVGNGVYSLINSILRQLVLILPLAFILGNIFGLSAVWWAFPLAEIGAILVTSFFIVKLYREKIRDL